MKPITVGINVNAYQIDKVMLISKRSTAGRPQ